ncbi:hypothetical protein OK074_8764, partial [Actinobacteria bacterium OK074]
SRPVLMGLRPLPPLIGLDGLGLKRRPGWVVWAVASRGFRNRFALLAMLT